MKNTYNNEDIFPIEKLIEVFENAIPIYKKAVDESWDYCELNSNYMHDGICLFCNYEFGIDIDTVINRYYQNYINYNNLYLFEDPTLTCENIINECIKPRLNFMKQEVKELRKLIKKRLYPHLKQNILLIINKKNQKNGIRTH